MLWYIVDRHAKMIVGKFDRFREANVSYNRINREYAMSNCNVVRCDNDHESFEQLIADETTVERESIEFTQTVRLSKGGRGNLAINITKQLHDMGLTNGDEVRIHITL